MSFFSRLFIYGSGVITGAYLDQKYKLPNVETKAYEYYKSNNKEIIEAIDILSNPSKYNKILN